MITERLMADSAVRLLSQDKIWSEAVCMKFRLEIGQLAPLLAEFEQHCTAMGVESRPLRAYKQHFVNWVYTRNRHNNEQTTTSGADTSRQKRDADFVTYISAQFARPKDDRPLW